MIKAGKLVFYFPLLIITALVGLFISISGQENTTNDTEYESYVKKHIEALEYLHNKYPWVSELMNGVVWGALFIAILF